MATQEGTNQPPPDASESATVTLPSMAEEITLTLFKCDVAECTYSSYNQYLFNYHSSGRHNKLVGRAAKLGGGNPCDFEGCSLIFSYKHTLKEHKRKAHGVNDGPLLQCDKTDCKYYTYSKALYKYHRATHGLGVGLVACTFPSCTFKADVPSRMGPHMAKHRQREPRSAPPAPSSSSDGASSAPSASPQVPKPSRTPKVAKVPRLPKGTSTLSCHFEGCTFTCQNASRLVGHTAAVHNFGNENVPNSFKCNVPECGYVATSVTKVKRHRLNVHKDETVVKICNLPGCSYRTSDPSDLKRHFMRKHNIGLVWNPCSVEGCEFKAKTALETRVHEERVHGIAGGKLKSQPNVEL